MSIADEADIPLLQAIDLATNKQLIEWGHPEAADFGSIPDEVARRGIAEERLWRVSLAASPNQIVGWLYLTRDDGELCVGQITVDPDWQQRGIGTEIMQNVIMTAIENGEPSILLNTQTDVPWNQPWYERLGFVAIPESEWSATLAAISAEQREEGLDWSTRTHMRLVLSSLANDAD